MSTSFPTFAAPPIAEIVLGVQFAQLPQLTSAHIGWFWKEFLGPEWPQVTDTNVLPDQQEVFGAPFGWTVPGIQIGLVQAPAGVRLQASTRDRMIQVQSTRFHYNWRKARDAYPRYSAVWQEFERYFNLFRDFVARESLGEVVPTQWELTYVDYVPRGQLWESPSDWAEILPGLLGSKSMDGVPLETLAGEWHFELAPRKGRLHVNVNLGKIGNEGEPGLLLQMTARGPISKESGLDLLGGLDFGHDATIRTFLNVTSSKAQKAWGLQI